MRYLILVEQTETGYSAYALDLPGCIAAGETPAGVHRATKNAISLHLDGLSDEGRAIPEPHSSSCYIEIVT